VFLLGANALARRGYAEAYGARTTMYVRGRWWTPAQRLTSANECQWTSVGIGCCLRRFWVRIPGSARFRRSWRAAIALARNVVGVVEEAALRVRKSSADGHLIGAGSVAAGDPARRTPTSLTLHPSAARSASRHDSDRPTLRRLQTAAHVAPHEDRPTRSSPKRRRSRPAEDLRGQRCAQAPQVRRSSCSVGTPSLP
jgi:hypothetical protein